MHTLHFLLVRADSASDAAATAGHLTNAWGDENNWRSIGGVASEDGSDDLENHDDGRWGLSDLPDGSGTAFERAVAWVRATIEDPVELDHLPFQACPTMREALDAVARSLKDFDPDQGDVFALWCASRNVHLLYETLASRRDDPTACGVAEFYSWQLDQFGLTDLTHDTTGTWLYLVMLDMHS